jgi:hypothetical protein
MVKCILYEYQSSQTTKHPKRIFHGFRGDSIGYKRHNLPNVTFQQTLARRKFATLLKIGRKLKFAQKALLKIRAINKIEN